jgi:uncharacterized protein YjlB
MIVPETHLFAASGDIPNSGLPLLLYRAAVPADPAGIERIFAAHAWPPRWRNGVFPWHHFHPHAHEALGVARGAARVLFGGPRGTEVSLQAGDVVVVPAGVGHCGLEASPDLLIVGAYPAGTRDTAASRGEAGAKASIAAVAMPAADPVAGTAGPLLVLWQG